MEPKRHVRAKQIFTHAIRLDQDARSRFVRRACEEDAELEAEVAELLEHHRPDTLFEVAPEDSEQTSRGLASRDNPRPGAGRRARRWGRVATAVLALSFVGFAVRHQAKKTLQTKLSAELADARSARVVAIRRWMAEWERSAVPLAARPSMRRHVAELVALHDQGATREDLWSSRARRALYDEVARYLVAPDSSWVELVAVDGVVLADRDRAAFIGMRLNRKAAAALSDALAGAVTFLPPYIEDGGATRSHTGFGKGRAVAAMLTPVVGDDGDVIAVLAFGRFMESALGRLLGNSDLGESGESYLIDEQGLMVSKSRYEAELGRLGMLDDRRKSSILNVQVRDPGGDLAAGFEPTVKLAARPLTRAAALALAGRDEPEEGARRGVVPDPYRNYRGATVIGAWAWLADYRVGVISELESDEAFAALVYLDGVFLGLAAIAMIATAGALAPLIKNARSGAGVGAPPQVGPYRIVRLIGEGGMGKVYLAEHNLLQRETAVKVIAKSDVERQDVARFEREVRAASALSHPHTIEIYDYGRTDNGVFYFAMEYLRGITLSQLVAEAGAAPTARCVYILEQICASLQDAHEHGIVHRDVKPPNIMLCRRGSRFDFVKVLDFGLAKRMESTTELTGPTQFGGTPLYMPPERLRDTRHTDVRSDIYSVGAVGYFLLSGRPMFEAETNVELLYKVINDTPAPLPANDVPAIVSDVILGCVAKDPDERPRSMADLLGRLRALGRSYPWSEDDARSWWEKSGVEY